MMCMYMYLQYVSKKNSQTDVQRTPRSRSFPVPLPFNSCSTPVLLPYISRSSLVQLPFAFFPCTGVKTGHSHTVDIIPSGYIYSTVDIGSLWRCNVPLPLAKREKKGCERCYSRVLTQHLAREVVQFLAFMLLSQERPYSRKL